MTLLANQILDASLGSLPERLVAGYADPLALWDASGELADMAATGRIYAR